MGPDGEMRAAGWETGAGPARSVRPTRLAGLGSVSAEGEETLAQARAWTRALAGALPDAAAPISVHLMQATTETASASEPTVPGNALAVAQVSLGGSLPFPNTTRTLLLPPPNPSAPELSLPGAWAAALAREVAGWDPALPLAAADDALPLVVDAFAAGELLRLAAQRWLVGRTPPGRVVTSSALTVHDPGPFLSHPEGERDARGTPMRPLTLVDGGRWQDPLAAGDTGSWLRTSWRRGAQLGWRSLRVELPAQVESAPWPAHARVVTRIVLLDGVVLGAGIGAEGGRAVARWELARLPGPDALLERVSAALDEEVQDGTGLPVALPPLLLL